MSFPEFATGLVLLALAAAFTGFTAFRLRARVLPGYTGAPGRLIEVVVAVGLLVVGSELLGLVGLLKPLPLLVLLGATALASWLWLMPRPVGPEDPVPPSPTRHAPDDGGNVWLVPRPVRGTCTPARGRRLDAGIRGPGFHTEASRCALASRHVVTGVTGCRRSAITVRWRVMDGR